VIRPKGLSASWDSGQPRARRFDGVRLDPALFVWHRRARFNVWEKGGGEVTTSASRPCGDLCGLEGTAHRDGRSGINPNGRLLERTLMLQGGWVDSRIWVVGEVRTGRRGGAQRVA